MKDIFKANGGKRIKVVIADHDSNYTITLKDILTQNPEIWFYGAFQTGQQLIHSMNSPFKPDVCLIETKLSDMTGIECAKMCRTKKSNIHIMIMADDYDGKSLSDANNLGLNYIEKGSLGEKIIDQIITNIDNSHQDQIISTNKPHTNDEFLGLISELISVKDRLKTLSGNQLKAVIYRKEGKSIDEISELLNIKRDTVLTHLKRASHKLKLPNLWDFIEVDNPFTND